MIRTLASTVKKKDEEILALKTEILELKGKTVEKPQEKPQIPINLKRKTPQIDSNPAFPQSDGFVFVKKPKVTSLSESSELYSTTPTKEIPCRRDKIPRADRKQLPGYSTPDEEGFYKAFSSLYDEQDLKNKVSEHRYEYPPAEVPSNYYKLDI